MMRASCDDMPLPPAHLVERPCADAAHAELPRERVLVAEALRVVVPDLTKSGVSEQAHAPPRVAATHKFVVKKLGNVESKQGLAKDQTFATYRHRMREIGMCAYIVTHCHRYLYRHLHHHRHACSADGASGVRRPNLVEVARAVEQVEVRQLRERIVQAAGRRVR